MFTSLRVKSEESSDIYACYPCLVLTLGIILYVANTSLSSAEVYEVWTGVFVLDAYVCVNGASGRYCIYFFHASSSPLPRTRKKSTFINLPRDICAHNFRDPAIKLQAQTPRTHTYTPNPPLARMDTRPFPHNSRRLAVARVSGTKHYLLFDLAI